MLRTPVKFSNEEAQVKQVEPSELRIPDHIPPQLVFDFDSLRAPEAKQCSHHSIKNLYKDAPRIFYTPRNGGHWIIARADEALDMLRQAENFSSDPKFCKAQVRELRTNPNRRDLPEHTESRKIASPVIRALFIEGVIPGQFRGVEQDEHWHSSPGRSG